VGTYVQEKATPEEEKKERARCPGMASTIGMMKNAFMRLCLV
jgi:hypothetical protein